MSLSIGVVNINYLEPPNPPMHGSMWDFMADPEVRLGDDPGVDEGYWDGGGNGENAFYQFYRDELVKRANTWAAEQNLNAIDQSALVNWIENLPYQNETDIITLHLSA